MKIKAEDYAALKLAFSRYNLAEIYNRYERMEYSPERCRWDILHASGFDTATLYTYLNDSHIDTALRRIIWEAIKV